MLFDHSTDGSSLLFRARLATAVFFFTNGAVIANLLPRLPQIKAEYHLSDDLYGVTVAALPAGAIIAGLAGGALTRRFGSARVATIGTLVTATALVAACLMPFPLLFALLLAVAGGADAVTDVAQNAHGLQVQRRYQRSIINSFHAVWSIGAVTGGLMSAAAVALSLPLWWHLLVSGSVCAALVLWAQRGCLPTANTRPEPRGEGVNPSSVSFEATVRSAAGPKLVVYLTLLALVLIATAGTMVEDMANSWATLYLGRDLQATTQVAPFGFPTIVGAQFVGRIAGDSLVNRWGYRNVVRFGGALIALGVGSAIAWPTIAVTFAGFVAAGFGSATLVPAAMHTADNLAHLRPGAGLTVVSWLMRLGFMLTAPTVGAIAATTCLRWGLSVVALAGAITVGLAVVLPGLVKSADVLSSKHD